MEIYDENAVKNAWNSAVSMHMEGWVYVLKFSFEFRISYEYVNKGRQDKRFNQSV